MVNSRNLTLRNFPVMLILGQKRLNFFLKKISGQNRGVQKNLRFMGIGLTTFLPEFLYITPLFFTYLYYLLISIPKPKFFISSSQNDPSSSFPDIMPVARGEKLLTPMEFKGPTVVGAYIYFSTFLRDDLQYQLYPESNDSGKLLF